MLIIISDLHLGDGTCGKPVSPSAYTLFANRLQELARNASWQVDGKYSPPESIDIVMMGDILDVLHSTRWLEKSYGEIGYVRPWTDFHAPEFTATLNDITDAIIKNNSESVRILRNLTSDGITLPAATVRGGMDPKRPAIPVKVRLHYMIGNHDWYYHLPAAGIDAIRKKIVKAFGLANSCHPFPHQIMESPELLGVMEEHNVFARHGDIYDPLNYSSEQGRDAASLGDAFSVEILNGFPVEVERHMGAELPLRFLDSLRELVNVRPALATPLWISSQMRQNNISVPLQKKVKELWNEMSREFLKLDFVQAKNTPYKLDLVDGLRLAITLSDSLSFKAIDNLVIWIRNKIGTDRITYAQHALQENAFLERKAQFIVYGHTHHHEIVPLDSFEVASRPTNQMYFNSGTWHTYFDLAIFKPGEQKFVPYQVLTYLSFFKGGERQGRLYETWSGSLSN
jgi:UDP-2,3-diacylglucosamine pyrophosphatase LpxH